MLHRAFVGGFIWAVAAAILLSLAAAPSAFAMGDNSSGDWGDDVRGSANGPFCPHKQVLVRTEEKVCPEEPGRPAVVLQRVCCRHGNTTDCQPFRPCPPRSHS